MKKDITIERPTSTRQVNKHLKHLGDVKLIKGEGYYYIYSDDEEMSLKIAGLYTSSIHVHKLNQQTIARWVEDVESLFTSDMNNR